MTLVRTGPFVAQEIRELGLPEVEFTTVFRWHDPTKPFVPLSAQAEPSESLPHFVSSSAQMQWVRN